MRGDHKTSDFLNTAIITAQTPACFNAIGLGSWAKMFMITPHPPSAPSPTRGEGERRGLTHVSNNMMPPY